MPYRVGQHLIALEYGQIGPSREISRVPGRLIVEARIEWLGASHIHVGLPQTQVVIDGETVILPKTTHKLDRYIQQAPWDRQTEEPGAPLEWKCQPFYPMVKGRWCTAQKATYYNQEVWRAYNNHINESPQSPRDCSRDQNAQMLGLSGDANRDEINAAFRSLVKKTHPDIGGSPDRFHQLLAARDSLLVKCAKV